MATEKTISSTVYTEKFFKNLHLLDIKKRKSMAGITFETIDSIDFDVLNLLITEGIEIDDWMRK